jgi:hypothetical protein
MQSTTDPGEVGTESLATTLAEEVKRIRFMLREITGKTNWYESPIASLAGLCECSPAPGSRDNRLVSGREHSRLQFTVGVSRPEWGSANSQTRRNSDSEFISTTLTALSTRSLTDVSLLPASQRHLRQTTHVSGK